MKFIHNFLPFFLGLWLINLNGQTLRVIDAITGYPVQDVIVYDARAKANTTSDANGHVDLSVFSNEDQLHFEHLGYESLLLRISELQSSTQLALYPDTQRLGEIVLMASRKHALKECAYGTHLKTAKDHGQADLFCRTFFNSNFNCFCSILSRYTSGYSFFCLY